MRDPYRILGIPKSASLSEIKAAYRKLARESHPDMHGSDPRAEEDFKEISAAYDILSNSRTRAQFDRGEIDASGARRAAAAYSKRQGSASRPSRSKPKNVIKINGADVEYSLKIGFLEALKGGVKHISTTNGKRLRVTVPPGIKDGKILRLKGQGMGGFGGGKAGDALVEILVLPDPMFRCEGHDIRLELPVSLPEAVLGAKVEVPTINGTVSLTIPPGSNTGTILRLKGKGLAVEGSQGKERGDQYVVLRVLLPKKPDDEFVEFVKSWSERNPYEVARGKSGD